MTGRISNPETPGQLLQKPLRKPRTGEEETIISRTAYNYSNSRIKLIPIHQQVVPAIFIIISLSVFFIPTAACSKKDNKSNLQSEQLLYKKKESLTPGEMKISSQLLHTINMNQSSTEIEVAGERKTWIEIDDDGRIMVDMKADVTHELLAEIKKSGGIIIDSSEEFNSIRARIYLNRIKNIANMEEVKFIRPAVRAITH